MPKTFDVTFSHPVLTARPYTVSPFTGNRDSAVALGMAGYISFVNAITGKDINSIITALVNIPPTIEVVEK